MIHGTRAKRIVRLFRQGYRVWRIAEDCGQPKWVVMAVLREAGYLECHFKTRVQRERA